MKKNYRAIEKVKQESQNYPIKGIGEISRVVSNISLVKT